MPYKTYAAREGARQQQQQPSAGTATTLSPGKSNMAAQPIPPAGQKAYPPPPKKPVVAQQEPVADVEMGEAGTATENGTKKNELFPRNKQDGGAVQKRFNKSAHRKRGNFKLRKLLAPKAPLMVVNELVGGEAGGIKYTIVDADQPTVPHMPKLYTAQATLMGETFTGTGPSHVIAKNICAEHIIQAIVTKKCNENKVKEEASETETRTKEDETPWASLASLAIFKLFNDWQAQGCVVPPELMHTSMERVSGMRDGRGQQRVGPTPVAQMDFTSETGAFHDFSQPGNFQQRPAKQMPANPTEKHPVQLLNELKGAISYELTGQEGQVPHSVFTMSCEIDGISYSGEGRSKKEAKKAAAIKALEAVYKITYPEPDVST